MHVNDMAQNGNRNAERGARFRRALDAEIENRGGQAAIQRVIAAMLDEAEKGEQWAVKEFFDRMAGKSVQAVEADVKGGLTIEVVRFAADPDSV